MHHQFLTYDNDKIFITRIFIDFRTIRGVTSNKAAKELLEAEEPGIRAQEREREASVDRSTYWPMMK